MVFFVLHNLHVVMLFEINSCIKIIIGERYEKRLQSIKNTRRND